MIAQREVVSTITAKGQTTVPKAIRQALGVDYGGRIAFRVDDNGVTLHRADVDQEDPAIDGFLSFLARDIEQHPGRITILSPVLAARIAALVDGGDANGEIDDDVDLQGIQVNGWTLYAHLLFLDQLEKLTAAVEKAREKDPEGYRSTAIAKLLAALNRLVFETIPEDPTRSDYRQGGTLGDGRKHQFRAKCGGQRFRLFFRYSTSAKVIIFAWVNDESSLRTYGKKTDAYAVFRGMLDKGDPPDDWATLAAAATAEAARLRLQTAE